MKRQRSISFLLICILITTVRAEDNPMHPLYEKQYNAASLSHDFPPQFRDANKSLVFQLANPPGGGGTTFTGTLTVSRWPVQPLPETIPTTSPHIEARPDFFTYDPPAPNTTEWHLNFAAHDLFAYYATSLLAQDELQVAEHPLLASLRLAMQHDHLSTFTVENNSPTPILITNVPRQAILSTDPNRAEGRPAGLYGNRFADAPADAIRKATHPLTPPTLSNIIAIEAPAHGHGEYSESQIHFILTTACTAFAAAKSLAPPNHATTIHTGFWGCGAYGGNRTLMTTLQLLAAQLAQIDTLIYHTGDKPSLQQFAQAQSLLHEELQKSPTTNQLISALQSRHFHWGTGDGN